MKGRRFLFSITLATWVALQGASPHVAFDMDQAMEICNNLPLESIEGVWLYPDDQVVVLILNDENSGHLQMPKYTISVVETSDVNLSPGEIIGFLTSTPEDRSYKIELATEKKNDFLLKPKTCLAKLSSNGDALTFKKQKTGIKGRLNVNFNRLLPGFWKIVSTGISTNGSGNKVEAATGMIKLYPSYDGNGSSRRKPRYL